MYFIFFSGQIHMASYLFFSVPTSLPLLPSPFLLSRHNRRETEQAQGLAENKGPALRGNRTCKHHQQPKPHQSPLPLSHHSGNKTGERERENKKPKTKLVGLEVEKDDSKENTDLFEQDKASFLVVGGGIFRFMRHNHNQHMTNIPFCWPSVTYTSHSKTKKVYRKSFLTFAFAFWGGKKGGGYQRRLPGYPERE